MNSQNTLSLRRNWSHTHFERGGVPVAKIGKIANRRKGGGILPENSRSRNKRLDPNFRLVSEPSVKDTFDRLKGEKPFYGSKLL